MNKQKQTIFFSLLATLTSIDSLAAACCGGNSAAPAIIVSDDQAQVSFSTAGSSLRSGWSQTLKLDGAVLLTDRTQLGASIPFSHKTFQGAKQSTQNLGVGDVQLNFNYEFLPEWTYSIWKPKGFVFIQTTFPTGKSIYETQSIGGTEVTGKGFYSMAAGIFLTKKWTTIDVYLLPEIHYSLEKEFQDTETNESFSVAPGIGSTFATGLGLSPGSGEWRLGVRIQTLSIPLENGATMIPALEASYLFQDTWSTYASASLQGFGLGIQKRWER